MSYSDMIIVKKYQRRRIPLRKITIKCILVVIFFLSLYYALLSTRNHLYPIFIVRSVEIFGLERLKEEEILDLSKLGSKANLLMVNLNEMYHSIKGNPWVKDIHIRKELPMRIIIEIAERKPEARIATKNGIYLVDNEGVVLEKADWVYDFLPLIKGMDHIGIYPGEKIDHESARDGLGMINHLTSRLNGNIRDDMAIDVSRNGDMMVYIKEYMLRFGTGSIEEKLDRFFAVEEDIRSRFADPIEVDLRFPRRVVVKPQKKGDGKIG